MGQSLLSSEEIERISAEANAWAMERRTTKAVVEFIENEVKRFAGVDISPVELSPGVFLWSKLSGVFHVSRAKDSVDMLLLMANLSHGLVLCHMFRQRVEEMMLPHEVTESGLGAMQLTDLTRRLNEVREQHIRLIEEHGDGVEAAVPQPTDDLEWTAPDAEGMVSPRFNDLDAHEAADSLVRRFTRIGFGTDRRGGDLVVACGRAKGLVSLSVFGSSVKRTQIDQIREDVDMLGASTGVILIKWCQYERLGLHAWDRPAEEPMPKIPIGTAVPCIQDFEASLLGSAIEAGSWPDKSIDAAEIPLGVSKKMPDWAEPGSEEAGQFQQAVVQRFARDALESIRRHAPYSFAIIWGIERVEVHTMMSPADLAVYVLRGPAAFKEIGGSILCSYQQPKA